jgi:signal transduction histidine kinase
VKEIVKVKLENEMDLILAHKRAMKLGELSGLSLLTQTSLATAVSEIARCAIEHGKSASLVLAVDIEKGRKLLKAIISDGSDFTPKVLEALNYAKRLVDETEVIKTGKESQVVLKQHVSFQGILTENKVQSIIDYFAAEPPISAYDELRRKNIMLQEFADKLRESDTDYRILTDSLPLMMFSVNNRGVVTYTNKWLKDFFDDIPQEISSTQWQHILHPSEYSAFLKALNNAFIRQIPFNGSYRFKEKNTEDYAWHRMSLLPVKNEKQIVTRWTGFLVDIDAQNTIDQTLKDNKELQNIQRELYDHQNQLQQKVIELNRSNHELEQFAHLATHDLQEPLRKLFFYSDVLKRKYGSVIDTAGMTVLNNMASAASRMRELINDLLSYSRLQKQEVAFEEVRLNEIISEVIKDLDLPIKEKNAVIEVAEFPLITGNIMRLRQLFNNLISNSLKYSRTGVAPVIQITVSTDTPELVITVRDNGIGFEEKHCEKIFGLFERLHTRDKFPGTGIGLSLCRKIAELHHGKISASSVLNEYAKFEITLPYHQNTAQA